MDEYRKLKEEEMIKFLEVAFNKIEYLKYAVINKDGNCFFDSKLKEPVLTDEYIVSLIQKELLRRGEEYKRNKKNDTNN